MDPNPSPSLNRDNKFPMKIVSLNEQCLEKILSYLDIKDLSNVAEANTKLAATAALIFAEIFKNNVFEIHGQGGADTRVPQWYIPVRRCSCLFFCPHRCNLRIDESVVKNLLKHFGKYIKKMKIRSRLGTWSFMHLVAEYCSATLLELDCDEKLFGGINQPFTRLEKLTAYLPVLKSSSYIRLNEKFPNMRSLELVELQMKEVHFPSECIFKNLEHFGIHTYASGSARSLRLKLIDEVAKFHPMVKSLVINDPTDNYCTPYSTQMLPNSNIHSLNIHMQKNDLNISSSFENLTTLKVHNSFGKLVISPLQRNLRHLEMMNFAIKEELITFLRNCPDLLSLSITVFKPLNLDLIEHMAKNLPHIENIEFISYEECNAMLAFSASIIFMKNCKRLRRVTASLQLQNEAFKFENFKWTYGNAEDMTDLFREELQKSTISDWCRWRMERNFKTVNEYMLSGARPMKFCMSLNRSLN